MATLAKALSPSGESKWQMNKCLKTIGRKSEKTLIWVAPQAPPRVFGQPLNILSAQGI